MRWIILFGVMLAGTITFAQDTNPVFDPVTVTITNEQTSQHEAGTPCAGVLDVRMPVWVLLDGCHIRTVRPYSPIPDAGTPATLTLTNLTADTLNFVADENEIVTFPYYGEEIGYSPTRDGSAAMTLLSPDGNAIRVLIVDNETNSRSDLNVTAFDIQGDLVSASLDFSRLIFADGTLYDLQSGQVRAMLSSGLLRQDTVSWLGNNIVVIRIREADGVTRFVTLRLLPSG